MSTQPISGHSLVNLGMIGTRSIYARYLQAHTDGELHASNPHRNEEETWFLIQVDQPSRVYALQNWRTGQFMSKLTGGCARANSTTLGVPEQWELVAGAKFGVLNAVAFRSRRDGTYLGANGPDDDDSECGGEVAARDPRTPPANDGRWPGWWVVEPATEPAPGKDIWNTVGGFFAGIAAKISPADVIALLKLL